MNEVPKSEEHRLGAGAQWLPGPSGCPHGTLGPARPTPGPLQAARKAEACPQ